MTQNGIKRDLCDEQTESMNVVMRLEEHNEAEGVSEMKQSRGRQRREKMGVGFISVYLTGIR